MRRFSEHKRIVPWCSGSTSDFGSASLSSSLGGTTSKLHKRLVFNSKYQTFLILLTNKIRLAKYFYLIVNSLSGTYLINIWFITEKIAIFAE